jgi:acetolactate synthase-1/2/3 large subunit
MTTLGVRLVELLASYGIDTVFGIPGVHTVELYRGLAGSKVRHITPRHEAAAGFMADGYWRASGRIAACFVITGPGVTNILTPMAQAYADCVPILVVSSVNRIAELGMAAGALHELRNQGRLAAECAAFSHTVLAPDQLPRVLDRAFAVFESARPRPVHIEIPLDLLGAPCPAFAGRSPAVPPPRPSAAAIVQAARILRAARHPVILAGGGARGGADGLRSIAERLDAPVVMTANGRGLLPAGHQLAVSASPSLHAVRALIEGSDAVLAVGTEFGPTDYDMYGKAPFAIAARLVRLEIDPEAMSRGCRPDAPVLGDAALSLEDLSAALGGAVSGRDGVVRARTALARAGRELDPEAGRQAAFLARLRDAGCGAAIVGDSTVAVYAGNLLYEPAAPRRWFNAATGYGALGYGLPAANGAALATGRPVICLTGDGGLQFVLAEFGTAVENRLPVVIVVWNNRGYREIRDHMIEAGVEPLGVDLHTPDFVAIARAYGMAAIRPDTLDAFFQAVVTAIGRAGPTLIELDGDLVMAG